MSQDIFNGVIPSPYSPYDYSCRVMAAKEHAAEYIIDTRGKAYDQEVGNCVAQTARAFARIVTGREYGVDMMYGGARTEDRETSGLIPREAADFFVKNGIALIADDPNETDVPEVIKYWNRNKAKLCNAAELSGGTWYRVESVEEIKCTLEAGVPVWCAVPWYGYLAQYEGRGLLRYTPDATPGGYHEMLIVGWKQCSDGERAVFLNSHGEDSGDGGYCYGKWEHVLELHDCLAMIPPKQTEPKEPIVIQRTLRLKDKPRMQGDDVKELQTLLDEHGFPCGEIDGIFGAATDKAVRSFQKAYNLTVDGIVGRKTWEALRKEPGAPTPTPDPNKESGKITSKQLVAEFEQYERDGWGYVYGAQGELYTEALAQKWHERAMAGSKSVPSGRNKASYFVGDCSRWIGKHVADCSGGIVHAIQQYIPGFADRTADGFMAQFTKSGAISTIPEIPGLAVWRKGHIGVYVGGGYVIEFRGTDYGCVKTKLSERNFTHWGMIKGVTYEVESNKEPYYGVCTGGLVNVRSGGSILHKIVGVAKKDDKLLVNPTDGWPEVAVVLNGKITVGYMSDKYVKRDE